MADQTLTFDVVGRDVSGSKTLDRVGDSADQTAQRVDRSTRRMGAGFAKFGRALEKDVGVRVDKVGGGLNLLSNFIGGPFGAALTAGAFAMDTVSTALSIVSVQNLKAAASWVRHRVAMMATAVAMKVTAVSARVLGIAMTVATGPIGLVVLAVAALVVGLVIAYKKSETFRKIVQAVFKAVGVAVLTYATIALRAFRLILNAWLTLVGAIVHGAVSAFGWVPKLGPKLKGAERAFNNFKDGVVGGLDKAADKAEALRRRMLGLPTRRTFVYSIRVTGAAALSSIGSPAGRAQRRQHGGSVQRGMPYIVGERRAEVFIPHASGRILPRVPSGGTVINVNVMVAPNADKAAIGRSTVDAIEDYLKKGGKLPPRMRTAS